MVLIVDQSVGTNKTTGEEFVMLVLQGDPVMVRSKETGRFYLTARKTSIPSTFTPEAANALIGTKMPGRIDKVEVDPYDYTIKETGEIIRLDYSWEYSPDENPVKEFVKQAVQQNGASKNGVLETSF